MNLNYKITIFIKNAISSYFCFSLSIFFEYFKIPIFYLIFKFRFFPKILKIGEQIFPSMTLNNKSTISSMKFLEIFCFFFKVSKFPNPKSQNFITEYPNFSIFPFQSRIPPIIPKIALNFYSLNFQVLRLRQINFKNKKNK